MGRGIIREWCVIASFKIFEIMLCTQTTQGCGMWIISEQEPQIYVYLGMVLIFYRLFPNNLQNWEVEVFLQPCLCQKRVMRSERGAVLFTHAYKFPLNTKTPIPA